MDMAAVEYGKNLSLLEQLAHERLLTARDWNCLIFWMDMEVALSLLTCYERHCLVANLIEGYTKEEIAKRLKVSRQAVLKQIKKAKAKMKDYLREGYETPGKCTLIWEAINL